ncbi:PMD domain-containing protein, partial [Cephalotus follicularis]
LQDVDTLQGLQIYGSAVTGHVTSDRPLDALCEELLGVRPTGRAISGTSLRFSWLHRNFAQLSLQLFYNPNILELYAWAYILCLLGSIPFPDSFGDTMSLMFLPMLTDLYDVNTYS